MTYNEAVVTAREMATQTLRSWLIYFDGKDDYQVLEQKHTSPDSMTWEHNGFRLKAVVNPVWME
ncbi:MAG: hypothetical protein HQL84_13820 [Magnetococcales bacterium]|nr:hypothetical protein [Magnetococcales bacterium]MBF0151113.1 hypothetical protein [Magnetococcales bacterium]MBF0174031.1 hypothetical protein [Magnetococcales bacterium]MBF0346776.1 hypothetical protein [Magnetococcales bacterium]MBF0630977.1 hypothetical protein [Magnetococcales bacterium]